MKKQLTTVQRNKRNRIIKRIIHGIILAIAIPLVYIYCSNIFNDFFDSLNTDVSVSATQKHISKVNKENDDTSEEKDENTFLDNNNEYPSNISKNNTTEITYEEKEEKNNKDISSSFSSYEPSISTDDIGSSDKSESIKNTNTSLSVPKEIEDEYLTNKSNLAQSTLEEINKNNEEIAKIQKQREELDAIKAKYNAKVSAIEAWYNEEYNKNYELMMEAKNTYEDLGGYATEDDKVKAYKDITSAGVEAYNSGLEGHLAGRIKSLEEKYELVCKRYAYSKQYDEYYEYIYTTLPAKKTEKLSIAVQEYNEDLQKYEDKYGL